MNFKTLEDMNVSIVKSLHKIRKLDKIDLVVGIPRSGIIPAANIALHLQLPYADLGSYLNGIAFGTSGKLISNTSKKNILLVDDSVNTGSAMKKALAQINQHNLGDKIFTYAVWYSDKTNLEGIDIAADFCPRPRVFQWNLWKHHKLGRFATDMDGVLCRDPSRKENDKGPNLLNFYKTADPKFLPERPIKYVITSRLEKYRNVTEEWLHRHNIKFEELIMKNDPSVKHGIYKANVLNNLKGVLLYIESDTKQARQISERVTIPVWCTDNQKIYKKE